MRPFAVLGLLLMVMFAGCSDSKEPAAAPTSAECLEQGLLLDDTTCVEPPFEIREFEDPNHFCVKEQRRDRVHAPDLVGNPWTLGQFWTYDLVVDGEKLGETKLVYYDNQDLDGNGVPAHYMVGTPTRDEAMRNALFGENPMIGRVHRVLYSPHESGDHADMFHFPLCDGSTWQTVFYGETFTLTATNATIVTPNGNDQGFAIEGTSDGGGVLKLSYSPAMQWFTYIDLDRSGGGTVDMTLKETGKGYSGEAYFLRGQKDETAFLIGDAPVANVMAGIASQTIHREDGGNGPYDTIAMHILTRSAGTGVAQFSITAPDETEVYTWSATVEGDADEAIIEVPYQAGDWVLDLEGLSLDAGQAQFYAHVTMVSIYDRSGSV